MTEPLRVAVVQAEVPEPGAAVARTAALAAEAAALGATLVAFPETWIPGYPAWIDVSPGAGLWDHPPVKAAYARMAEASVDVNGPMGRELGRVAGDLGIALVVGVSERVERGPGRGTLYNAILTYDADGRLANHHRKLVPTYTERMIWGPGDAAGLRAVETAAGRVGALVCWEHWMPLARQALHESGEDVHVAVWPMVKEMNHVASRHYAFEGRCFVLAAGALLRAASLPDGLAPDPARAASGDAWVLRGGSAIVGPDGAYLAEPLYDAPGILVADLDPRRIREETMTLDVTGHYHRPDCFDFQTLRPRREPASAAQG